MSELDRGAGEVDERDLSSQPVPAPDLPAPDSLASDTLAPRTPQSGAGGRRSWIPTTLVWCVVAPCLVWAAVRVLGLERGTPGVQLVAFTPYAGLACLAALTAAALARRWAATTASMLALIALAACVLPRAIGSPTGLDGVAVTVMSANLRVGGADPGTIVGLVRSRGVDILALQEVTTAAVAALDSAGLARLLPHRAVNPVAGVGGSAIYARLPISASSVHVNPGGFTQVSVVVSVSGAGALAVESVHPVPPQGRESVPDWAGGLRGQTPAPAGGPLHVLAGDFNATLDHAELRRLIGTGYSDAAAAVGSGLTPTWPYYGARATVTPKIAIDHVLVDDRIGVRDFAAISVPRTDHRAILTTLILPIG